MSVTYLYLHTILSRFAVSPIGCLLFDGNEYKVPLGRNNINEAKGIGPLGEFLLKKLWDIQVRVDPRVFNVMSALVSL